MPKRPHPWQLAKQRTAKGLRELPKCATKDCTGRQMGAVFGSYSKLCPDCQRKAIADRWLKRTDAPRES